MAQQRNEENIPASSRKQKTGVQKPCGGWCKEFNACYNWGKMLARPLLLGRCPSFIPSSSYRFK
jgi:hypothetical protein